MLGYDYRTRGREELKILRQKLLECSDCRKDLLNRLVEVCAPDVLAMAHRHAGDNQGLREDLEDHLIGALIQTAERYDPLRGEFWTYAKPTLEGSVRMFFRNRRREIAVGLTENRDVVCIEDQVVSKIADTQALMWARRMLREVGLPDDSIALDALLRRTSICDAARSLDMDYDVLRRKIKRARKGRAVKMFLATVR